MRETETRPLDQLTPAEIDAQLSELWKAEQQARANILSYRNSVANEKRRQRPHERQIADFEGWIAKEQAKVDAARAGAQPFEAEFSRRGGWNRYFLVTNDNGHVHRGTDCSTCFRTTQYAWLIDLADCDEDAMIEEWGEKACTVCFPSAPTNPAYHRPSRVDQEAREARQAEKAARDADKAAKAITAPDGSPLRVGYDTLRTKVAAQRALSGAVKSFGWYGPTHPSDFAAQIRALSEALDAAGIDPRPIIERASKASAKEGAPHVYREKGSG